MSSVLFFFLFLFKTENWDQFMSKGARVISVGFLPFWQLV